MKEMDAMDELSQELKDLAATIHGQQKAIAVAVVSILLFLCAPHTNEVLRTGAQELRALQVVALAGQTANRLGNHAESRDTLNVVGGALEKSTSEGKTVFKGLSSLQMQEGDRKALGIASPTTLAELVELLEGRAKRCRPDVDAKAIEGLAVLRGAGPDGDAPSGQKQPAALMVRGIHLLSVRDDDAKAAAVAVLDAASGVADALRAETEAKKGGAGSSAGENETREAVLRGAPPQLTAVLKNGNYEWAENPDYQTWLKEKQKHVEKQKKVLEEKQQEAQLVEKGKALSEAMAKLRAALATQSAEDGTNPPRFVVARLDLAGRTRFSTEASGGDRIYLPMKCAHVPVLSEETIKSLLANGAAVSDGGLAARDGRPGAGSGATRLLRHLRATDEWEKVKSVPLEVALEVADQELLKNERTLDVFGFQVQERLLARVAPWLLTCLLFWHAVYAWRFRREVASSRSLGALRAAAVVPTVPTRQNWPLPLVATAAVAVVGIWLWCLPNNDWASQMGDGLAIGLASVAFLLTLRTRIPAGADPKPSS
jgi:hypothetical protein